MNENLGINTDSYLEWNILLAVLALFGNFPYGPPLSPNGIWDSFVSLSVSLAHQRHEVVYAAGNFLRGGCIGDCACGNWGFGGWGGTWQSLTHKKASVTNTLQKKKRKPTLTRARIIHLCCVVDGPGWHFCTQGTWVYLCHTCHNVFPEQSDMYITSHRVCNGSSNVNLAKQDFKVPPGTLEMRLQYEVKGDETWQAVYTYVCVGVGVCTEKKKERERKTGACATVILN